MGGFTVVTRPKKGNKRQNEPCTVIPRITLQQTITSIGKMGPITDHFASDSAQPVKQKASNDNCQPTLEETWKISTQPKQETQEENITWEQHTYYI